MSGDSWNDGYAGEPGEEDGLSDPEGPQAGDLDGPGDADEYELVPCPHCGHEISELTQRCPYCGDWIIPGSGRSKRRPLWIAIAILLLLLILLWLF